MLKILVTGANGQLGSELRRLSSVSPNSYLFTDVAELDVTDESAVDALVGSANAPTSLSTAPPIPTSSAPKRRRPRPTC